MFSEAQSYFECEDNICIEMGDGEIKYMVYWEIRIPILREILWIVGWWFSGGGTKFSSKKILWAILYATIQELVQYELSLTNIELVERCLELNAKVMHYDLVVGWPLRSLKGVPPWRMHCWKILKYLKKKRSHFKSEQIV